MNNIEAKKFKHLGITFLLFVIFLAHMLISLGLTFSKSALNSEYYIYKLFDAYLLISMIINPILISSIAKKSIEIEEKNNMWQLQLSLGEKVTDILLNKYKYLSRRLFSLQIIEWILIVLLSVKSNYFVLSTELILRLLILFLAVLFANLFFLALFMILEMRTKKVYFTSFLSIIGSLSGIICMLTSKLLSYINPFAWISCLINISYYKEGNEFIQVLNPANYYIPALAFLLLLACIGVMKNMKKMNLEKE